VGKGTYLRSLARDLGEILGIPAHCKSLRRTCIGSLSVEGAIEPAKVAEAMLRPAAAMVAHLPVESVSEDSIRELGFGRRVPRTGQVEGPAAMVAESDGRLVAVAEPAPDGCWQPVVVLEPAA
jgi:tRNA pseudouridine55 synthase